MHTLTIPQMQSAVSHIALALREPLMIWGQPGAGKTEGVYQSCEANNGILIDVRLGQYDSVDLRGFPVADEELNQAVWYAPITLPFKGNPRFDTPENRERPIYLFLDEINQCQNAVFGVAMQLLNEKRIGEHELMDNVVLVCAGNREGDRGTANRMPTTVANRLTHIEVGLDHDAWCYWAQQQDYIDPIFVAFMQFRSNLLSTFDPAKPNKAFATPRTWAKAAKYYGSNMPSDIKQAAMAGAIGDGPSAEFWGFRDVWSKMTPISEIIKNPTGVELPKEAAMRYAVAVACSGAITKETVTPLNTFLMRMDPEFAVLAWQLAMQRDRSVCATSEFVSFAKQYRQIFQP